MTIRDHIERYLGLGLNTVPARGKFPVMVELGLDGTPLRTSEGKPKLGWKPFQERFPTDAEWRAAQWHRATGVVLINGPATWRAWPYLWVLDIEAEHRASAKQWLNATIEGWRSGVVVLTGSRGLHVYALHDKPVKTDSTIPWGEIRGHSAVCVLPPSIHPETGCAYRFVNERWTNLPQIDPAVIPGASRKQDPEFTNEKGWAARWLRTPIAPGGRRGPDGIPKIAGYLLNHEIERETAIAIIELWNRTNPVGLSPEEIRKHVESIYDRYAEVERRPRLRVRTVARV